MLLGGLAMLGLVVPLTLQSLERLHEITARCLCHAGT